MILLRRRLTDVLFGYANKFNFFKVTTMLPNIVFGFRIVGALSLLLVCTAVCAASITVQVTDATGHPLADAVVYVEPETGQSLPKQLRPIEIEQKGRKFAPLVTVVQSGTTILFPNNDTVKHHIYSFSPAKTFEQKLYSGIPEKPIVFDKTGTVVLGCNIHDQMLAYILIVDTPYFAKTGVSGKVKIEVPAGGKFRVKVWHFGLPANEIPEQSDVFKNGDAVANFKLNVKSPAAKSEAKPSSYQSDY